MAISVMHSRRVPSFMLSSLYLTRPPLPTLTARTSRVRGLSSVNLPRSTPPCSSTTFTAPVMASPDPSIGTGTGTAPSTNASTTTQSFDPLVQYVVVRRDLCDEWPRGSVMAQAVHAAVSAIWKTRSEHTTVAYCSQPSNNLGDGSASEGTNGGDVQTQMHTVVLEIKNEAGLLKLGDRLRENNVEHVLWREQPENFVTALATGVYRRSEVKRHFSKLRLLK